MQGKRLLHSIQLRNLLSYGPSSEEIELQPLNVLIGPNGSGKSNLLEAVGLLKATSGDLRQAISAGGGIAEWLWKGNETVPTARIEAVVEADSTGFPTRYSLSFGAAGQRLELVDETIDRNLPEPDFHYRYSDGDPDVNIFDEKTVRQIRHSGMTRADRPQFKTNQSVLSQLGVFDLHPELDILAERFRSFRSYRDWNIGPNTPIRQPQQVDLPQEFLFERLDNLGPVLNDLQNRRKTWETIVRNMTVFNENVEDIRTLVQGGTIQVYIYERRKEQPIPATRLSDGTLRYLSLLVILCHPEPPPLICIEEPELGMHPDIIPVIAELLVEASKRTQLIITTHSDLLVSQFDDCPEAILVCEQRGGETHLRRLGPDEEDENLSLGDRWLKGQLGGVRW